MYPTVETLPPRRIKKASQKPEKPKKNQRKKEREGIEERKISKFKIVFLYPTLTTC